jgi:RNA polymerase sigma factor (sigma-70 family)
MEAQSLPVTGRRFVPRSPRILAAFGDDRLVEQLRRGNEAAFETIYDRHHRAMLSFCRHMLSSADEAEDAVQQTFISAYNKLREDGREINLKPWLYTIARNRCLSILRARREQPAEIDEVPTAGLSEEVQQRSDLRELLGDLRELPEDQRAALVLSELGDLSHAEIGHIVGCEGQKVKSLVFQARSSLIESRNAREIPCHEIREQLATASGGELRRGPLRRHLRACEGCAQFRDEVRHQRRAIAAILPVIPSLGLKESALAAVGIGGGGGGIGMGLLGSGLATKAVAVVAVAGVGVGGGLIIESKTDGRDAVAAGGQKDGVTVEAVATKASGPGGVKLTKHRGSAAPGRTGPAANRPARERAGAGKQRGQDQGRRGNGRRANGNGPGSPGSRGGGSTGAAPPASAPAMPAPSNEPRGGGGARGNNGNRYGWDIGRGNPHNPTGTNAPPPGQTRQPQEEPAPAPSDDGPKPRGNGNANANGHDPKPRLALPLLPAS